MSESEQRQNTPKNLLRESTESPSLSAYVQNYFKRIQAGDMGGFTIILGVIVIAFIFQSLNENFLTPRNIVNLIVQMAGITTIAIGVVFVLLLGEIDLSIGHVSAVAAVTMAIVMLPSNGWPWYLAISLALIAVGLIGIGQGLIITRFQLPSFVVTLAGLLVWNGVVLLLIGNGGTVTIQDQTVINIANYFLPPVWGWIVAIVSVALFASGQINRWRSRRKRDVSLTPLAIVVGQIVLVAALTFLAVYICNLDRGVPFVGVLVMVFLVAFSFLAMRTRFGRYVYAIGGNMEAARRAGINVSQTRIKVFMISSIMAGMGGIILASRLRSVDAAAGGGNLMLNSIAAAVIGGTSLFGGSGRVMSAFLGALVIASVENGMGLMGYSSGVKFVVTGLVLLGAVIIDAITRQGRTRSGIA
jgi:D-xylose transport system permease protein